MEIKIELTHFIMKYAYSYAYKERRISWYSDREYKCVKAEIYCKKQAEIWYHELKGLKEFASMMGVTHTYYSAKRGVIKINICVDGKLLEYTIIVEETDGTCNSFKIDLFDIKEI